MNEYTFNKIAEQAFDAEIQKIAAEVGYTNKAKPGEENRHSRKLIEANNAESADDKQDRRLDNAKLTKKTIRRDGTGSKTHRYFDGKTTTTNMGENSKLPSKKSWDSIDKYLGTQSFMEPKADSVSVNMGANGKIKGRTAHATNAYGLKNSYNMK